MADPKGTYFSPTTPEQGWATVLPERPHKSYASMLAKEMAGRRKLAEAEDKAREAALADLNGLKVGRLFHGVMKEEMDKLLEEAPNMDSFELRSRVVQYKNFSYATQDVDKVFDANVKWAQQKTVPVKLDEWTNWHNKFYANPNINIAEEWAQNPPDKTAFLREDGGSKYIDVNKAVKMVVKDNFDGFAKDDTEWKRMKWDATPLGGYAADLRTFQTKVQAFSKYDPETNSVVMKSGPELYADGILEPFKQNEFTNRALIDKAKTMIMERTGAESVDDADVTDLDLADALEAELLPYVKGVISERGMTLAIRPSGGGGGAKVDRPASLDLFIRQVSQGVPSAVGYPIGGKWGETGDIIEGTSMVTNVDRDQVRKNYDKQDWFKPLTNSQKEAIVNQTITGASGYEGRPAVLLSVVIKRPYTQPIAGQGAWTAAVPRKYEYEVITFDPAKSNSSEMARLYEAGRGATGYHYEEMVGKQGQKQMGQEYQQAKGFPDAMNTGNQQGGTISPFSLIPGQR